MSCKIKIKLNRQEAEIFLGLIKTVELSTIDDISRLSIFYYFKDNEAKLYGKFIDKTKKQITFSFTVPEAAAIIAEFKTITQYPIDYIIGELHKQVINYVSTNYFEKTEIKQIENIIK